MKRITRQTRGASAESEHQETDNTTTNPSQNVGETSTRHEQALGNATPTTSVSQTERTSSTENTSSTNATTSTEQTTTTETTESHETERTDSVPALSLRGEREHKIVSRANTVRTVISRKGSSRSSTKRRLELLRQLELEKAQLAEAQARAAISRTELELFNLPNDTEDDLSEEEVADDPTPRIREWVRQIEPPTSKAPPRLEEQVPYRPLMQPSTSVEVGGAIGNRLDSTNSDRKLVPQHAPRARSPSPSPPPPPPPVLQVARTSLPTNAPRFINDLQPFDGDPCAWIAFKAVFDDTKQYFSDIDNVARLRKALKGKARDDFRNTIFTFKTPEQIIEALERRFGRPKRLIKNEIALVERLPRMDENGRNIITYATVVGNCVAMMEALQRPEYLDSIEVADKITEKFCSAARFHWAQYRRARMGVPRMIVLKDFLNDLADDPDVFDERESSRQAPARHRNFAGVHVTSHSFNEESGDSETDSDPEVEVGRERRRETVAVAKHNRDRCPVCEGTHEVAICKKFGGYDIDKRWDTVKSLTLCFKCLRAGSHRSLKCKAKACTTKGCNKPHHTLLHREKDGNKGQIVSVNNIGEGSKALLKVVPVVLKNREKTVETYALLDEGSTITLIDADLAKKLGAKGEREDLLIEGVGGHKLSDLSSERVAVQVRGAKEPKFFSIHAYTMKELKVTSQSISRGDIKGCPHLQRIGKKLCTYASVQPKMLIGQDNWHLIVTRELVAGNPAKPVASRTELGWAIHGCSSPLTKPIGTVNHVRKVELDDLMREHWSLESLGIEPKTPSSDPASKALNILAQTTRKLPGEGYETGLLWKDMNVKSPPTRHYALKRLTSIEAKMDKDVQFKKEYSQQIENLLSSGYAEEVTTPPSSDRAWYLPHFAVRHPQKKKIRLVFDAAAKVSGTSLNDLLLPGPDLLQSLFGVLVRFREGAVALVADVQEMFLRVKIRNEDRDSLRFLWRCKGEVKEYRMTSLIFGAASSPCTAIYIKDFNARETCDDEVIEQVTRNHYMDDYLGSFSNPSDAIRIAKKVDATHRSASFYLRGWASNCHEVQSAFSNNGPASGDVVQLYRDDNFEKTLGLKWNLKSDTLSFTLNLRNTPQPVLKGERPPTKREVTSAVMSVFDPLGLASPVLIHGKILIQNIWRSKVGWDDKIKPAELELWREWVQTLELLQSLQIPRSLTQVEAEGELHIFTDASEVAYGAVGYWRQQEGGKYVTRLIASKSRVTPLKPASIPRLELQAAVVGSRLAVSLTRELRLNASRVVFWTDSRTVLLWLHADHRTFKPFVAHRLAEIEASTDLKAWRWVPTKENVADDITRNAPANFNHEHRWFNGPSFLQNEENTWPDQPVNKWLGNNEDSLLERKTKAILNVGKSRYITKPAPRPERFSSFNRLVRATARFLQAVEKFKSLIKIKHNVNITVKEKNKDPSWKIQKKQKPKKKPNIVVSTSSNINFPPLNSHELDRAEKLIIFNSQRESFSEEIRALENEQQISRTSKLKNICVKLQDNFVLLSTRVGAASYLSTSYKNPYVLDGKHYVSRLYIKYMHIKFHHGNHETVMNEIRQKFYVLSLRNTTKGITQGCVICKLAKSKPSAIPEGDLPKQRLCISNPPFHSTAVDYFGPMNVTIGRRHEKRWCALFTCMTTRAIHLELAASLSADSMILALRRMCARRGTPKYMYSDNGSNFVRAHKELEVERISQEMTSKGIDWKFIPPGAPHMGGAWERLVRSVKVSLSAILHAKCPKEEVLHTLLLEAEHIVNSRPITHVSLDPCDAEALTPNHFLIGRSSGIYPLCSTENTNLSKANWKTAQGLAQEYWSRWLREYLPTIVPRKSGGNHYENPAVGDIVLIIDSSLPRCTWPRGEVIHVYPGKDEKVRVVEVRTPAGVLRRPASRLVILVSAVTSASAL